jgi:hypothetical protein
MSEGDYWEQMQAVTSKPPPEGCVGDLALDDVYLDQLRQAIFERVDHAENIPELMKRLNATDWVRWMNDAGARIGTCAECNRYVRMSEATHATELVWLDDALLCHECAERLRIEHTFTCDVCGHEFFARTPPAPFNVCPECVSPSIEMALSSLATQLARARKLDLPATLTPREWLDTLDYFTWRCAYCLRADFTCMDHYVPVIQGGGTTQGNCVPACASCNSAKGGRAPQGYLIKAHAFTRVAEYLAQFAQEQGSEGEGEQG